MDLEIMSWSKEDISVPSFQTLHTNHTTTEETSLVHKILLSTSENPVPYQQ